MSNFKTVDDLSPTPASIGGAISKWPYRTMWWACRNVRTHTYDPGVIEVLQRRNLKHLARLQDMAERNDMDGDLIGQRMFALEKTPVMDMIKTLRKEYRNHYNGDDRCPYEQTGKDFSCHQCPVPGRAMQSMVDDIDV